MAHEEKAITVIAPQTTLTDFKGDVNSMVRLVKNQMRQDQDYGIIPGTKKKTLYDPGAEKLAKFFGLVPDYSLMKEIENFEKGFFYYKYKCTLTHFKTGKIAGAAERSCNSFEKKYLYTKNWQTRQDIRKTPEQLVEIINTIQAMAQKRAFVEAVKTATMASEIFTTDISEDDIVPEKPATQEADPERVKLLKRLFVIAGERGFSEKLLKDKLYVKYGVDSLTKLTGRQISETVEMLESKFDVVPSGSAPKLIIPVVNQPSTPEDPESIRIVNHAEPVEEKVTAPGKIPCYCGCGEVPAPGKAYNDYFINKEHHEKWMAATYPGKVKKLNPDELMKRLQVKSSAAPDTDKAAHTA